MDSLLILTQPGMLSRPTRRPLQNRRHAGRRRLGSNRILVLGLTISLVMAGLSVFPTARALSGPVVDCIVSQFTSFPSGLVEAGIGGGDYTPGNTVTQASVNWGDGNGNIVTVSDYPNSFCNGNFTYPVQFASPLWTHTYAKDGSYRLTQCLMDNAGLSACESILTTVTITDGGSATGSGGGGGHASPN